MQDDKLDYPEIFPPTVVKRAYRVWMEFVKPQDDEALRLAENGHKFRDALDTVDGRLRSKLKYGNLPEKTNIHLREIRDLLWEELQNVPRGADGSL